MSKSFARHYHSYKYIPAALMLFIFAFAVIYNIAAGFLSDGIPVGMVVMDSNGNPIEASPMLWIIMHFMMLSLMFIVIVMVAYAWDTKHEPRQMIRHPIISRDALLEQRRTHAREAFAKQLKQGVNRHNIRDHLLNKGHSDKDIEEALNRHKLR